MKSNEALQKDVQDAIQWEPLLNAAEIGVTAKDGVITLTGIVNGYNKKLQAEEAAKNVNGVKAVVEKIKVQFNTTSKISDNEIAKEVLNAFKWNWEVPEEKLKVKVEDGWITLNGEVSWNYQKKAALDTVCNLLGVKGVTNNIELSSRKSAEVEKKMIEEALERNWSINNKDIHIKVNGNKVTLSGTVDSWYQKNEAERIAYNAPGVWQVENELLIEYEYSLI